MHIHQMSIDNFKSFAEKTVIPFEQGFTTISGPNGSGKSNIIDSILFCLGLSTSRTMRAEKLSDLINNMSKRKEAIVTITFQKDGDDLEREKAAHQTRLELQKAEDAAKELLELAEAEADSTLADADVNADADTEPLVSESVALTSVKEISLADLGMNSEFVQVSRRIKGSPSGYTSTYYLNGRTTTLTEIHDYLGQYNISPGTYNVMMQGDVAGIVNMSPVERRKIVDEIAGVAEFDRKIEQAQRELEATGANIERNTILLLEIESRMEQLATERDHALKYQKLRDEKIRYEGLLLSAKYIDLKKAIFASNQNIAKARQEKDLAASIIQKLVGEIKVTHEQLLDLSNQVKRKGEDQQIALKKQIEGLKGHIFRKEDAIRSVDEKTAENNRRVEQMKLEVQRMQENSENIDLEIQLFQQQLKELQELFDNEAKDHERLNKKFDSLTGSSGELSVQRAEVRKKLTEQEDAFSQLNRQKLDTEAEIKRHQFEMDLRLRSNSEHTEKLTVLGQREIELTRESKDLELEKSAFEAQLNKIQLDYSQARVNLNQAQAKYSDFHREYVQLEARQRAYDEVNFTRAVDTILRSDLPGVHGTIAQLGDVNQEYALAMEIALGGRIQNIVVDSEQVASDGIQFLQQNRTGRATFLPLTKIQAARSLPPLPRESGVIDFAANLIEHDLKYEDVFSYALGDTLIVEDMQAARRLLRKYRMVTLDGSLMEKSGAMTGGSQPNRGKGNFFGGGQIEQELQTLAKRMQRAEADKDQLQSQLSNLEIKMDTVKTDYALLMQRYSRISAELESVTKQLDEIRTSQANAVDVSDLTAQVERLQKEITQAEADLQKRQAAIDSLNKDLTAIENQLPSDQIDELRKEMQDVKYQMEHYDTQMRNVKGDIQSKEMEKNFQQVGVKDCDTRSEQATLQNAELVKERLAALEEIELTQRQIDELEAQTLELDEELKKLQEERDQVQALLIEQEKQKNIQERNVTQLEEQIHAFQARKRELEPQMQQIIIDLKEAGIEPEGIEEDKLPSGEEVNQNIQRLTKRMESMEPVNMLAIDEYERVQERRDELAEKINTLTSEREAINVRISGYHELKLTSFMKAYESIDESFRNIFAELSDGSGQLMLTNPDAPFDGGLTIHAQPRGKKMLRIEGLSGGEKSLTSLAFVFSIQRYMPAPFYALDEVDQNLDGINAEKLANMVKQEAQRAQFVVVSLRKPMIECSERTIGVTQRQNGITKVTGIKHRDATNDLTDQNLSDLINEIDPEKASEKTSRSGKTSGKNGKGDKKIAAAS